MTAVTPSRVATAAREMCFRLTIILDLAVQTIHEEEKTVKLTLFYVDRHISSTGAGHVPAVMKSYRGAVSPQDVNNVTGNCAPYTAREFGSDQVPASPAGALDGD